MNRRCLIPHPKPIISEAFPSPSTTMYSAQTTVHAPEHPLNVEPTQKTQLFPTLQNASGSLSSSLSLSYAMSAAPSKASYPNSAISCNFQYPPISLRSPSSCLLLSSSSPSFYFSSSHARWTNPVKPSFVVLYVGYCSLLDYAILHCSRDRANLSFPFSSSATFQNTSSIYMFPKVCKYQHHTKLWPNAAFHCCLPRRLVKFAGEKKFFFRFLWPCIVSKEWTETTNKMQQLDVYY